MYTVQFTWNNFYCSSMYNEFPSDLYTSELDLGIHVHYCLLDEVFWAFIFLKNVQNLIFSHHLFVWHIVFWAAILPTPPFPRIGVTLAGILMFFVLFWFLFVLPPWSVITLVFTVTWVTVAMLVLFLWLSILFPVRGFWYITFRITPRVRPVFLVFFGLLLLHWWPWSWPVCTMNCLALILHVLVIIHYLWTNSHFKSM